MKTNIKLIAVLLLVALCSFGQQNTMTQTTLSASVISPFPASAGAPPSTIVVASATGITAAGTNNKINTWLLVDRELMSVISLSGTTITVRRGQSGSQVSSHLSGAAVWVGPQSYYLNSAPIGYCVPNNIIALPAVVASFGSPASNIGDVYQCSGSGATAGIWTRIVLGATGSPNGSNMQAFCTGTTGSAETEFLNGAACSGATTATARYVVSQAGVVGNLQGFTSAAGVGTAAKEVLTVLKNGTNTTITCTFGTAVACSDTTHYVQVAAGDVITFSFITATSDTAANISAGLGLF